MISNNLLVFYYSIIMLITPILYKNMVYDQFILLQVGYWGAMTTIGVVFYYIDDDFMDNVYKLSPISLLFIYFLSSIKKLFKFINDDKNQII